PRFRPHLLRINLLARFTGILGLITMLLLAWLFSTNRRAIRLRTVAWGVGLQIVFAFIVLRWSFGRNAMAHAGNGVNRLLSYAFAGSQFLFAALYHLGIMQLVIRAFAWGMQRTMKISGAESLNVAASIFMGQTEAPLSIRPFLSSLTRSELMTIMTSGMAHVSGGIMAAYIL